MSSGVYVIRNKVNGRVYVGSTVSFSSRKQSHFGGLRRGKHHCPWLLAAWKKYGEGAFEFVPLIICSRENLLLYEDLAIKAFGAYGAGYNGTPFARGGKPHSAATRTLMSKRKTGSVVPIETRAKISASLRGKTQTAETRMKRASSMRGKNSGPSKLRGRAIPYESRMKTARAKAFVPEETVRTMRRRYDDGGSPEKMAREFSISHSASFRICKRESYRWVV